MGRLSGRASRGGDPIDSFADELTVAALAVATGQEAVRLSGSLAQQALRICLAEIDSVRRQIARSRLHESGETLLYRSLA